MSTLWTPGGEVPIGDRPGRRERGEPSPRRERPPQGDPFDGDAGGMSAGSAASASAAAAGDTGEIDLDSLSPEDREIAEQYIREVAEARERIRQAPAAVVVANHAMGLYELAALHLSDQPPNFTEAAVAIDALGALLDGMKDRLDESEATLRDGLSQLRMAFVELKKQPTEVPANEGTP